MERLRAEGLTVGDNETYTGADGHGYNQHTHGDRRGLANVLIEVRQDLIDTPQGAALWAERLGAVLEAVLGDPALYRIEHHRAAESGAADGQRKQAAGTELHGRHPGGIPPCRLPDTRPGGQTGTTY